MYDFNVTVKADFLYEIIGSKSVQKHDQRDGAYMSTAEVKVRCTSWEEVIKYIRTNRDVTIKQVVEMKDMTSAAQNQARDTGGYKD